MKLSNYETMKSNYETIKEFAKAYREQLTVCSGILSEEIGLCDRCDYEKFTSELSDDEFVGNYLMNLYNEDGIQAYKDILEGKSVIEDYIEQYFGEEIKELYLQSIEH